MTPEQEREIELLTIRNLMKQENGRSFIWRCLQHSNVYGNTFDIDPIKNAYNAGVRNVGLWLEHELKEAAPESYLQMIKEHINE